jgi:hypothetical protein
MGWRGSTRFTITSVLWVASDSPSWWSQPSVTVSGFRLARCPRLCVRACVPACCGLDTSAQSHLGWRLWVRRQSGRRPRPDAPQHSLAARKERLVKNTHLKCDLTWAFPLGRSPLRVSAVTRSCRQLLSVRRDCVTVVIQRMGKVFFFEHDVTGAGCYSRGRSQASVDALPTFLPGVGESWMSAISERLLSWKDGTD